MVEGNEAMLLPAQAKGHDFIAALADFFQTALDDALGRITPGFRILFDMTPRQSLDKRVRRAGLGENFPELTSSTRPLQVVVPLSRPRHSIVEFEFEARSRQLV